MRDAASAQSSASSRGCAPPAGSLADALFTTAATAGPVPLFMPVAGDGPGRPGGPVVSAVELRDQVVALALGLVASGVTPGSRVALLTRNLRDWAALAHALWTVGAEVVAVHPDSSRARIGWILRDAGCAAVAVENERGVMTVGPLCSSLPRVRHVWQLDDGALDALAGRGRPLPAGTVESLRRLVPPDATAVVAYEQSGADRPRGRLLSHRGLTAARDALLPVLQRLTADAQGPPAVLSTAPLSQAYGLGVLTACVRGGLLLGHRPEPDGDVLRLTLGSSRPTVLCTDPHTLASLRSSLRKEFLRSARREGRTAGRAVLFERAAATAREFAAAVERRRLGEGPGPGVELRMQHTVHDRTVHRTLRAELGGRLGGVLTCGAPLDGELALSYAGIGVPVHETYGLTEAGGVVTAHPPGQERTGSAGRPLPGTRIQVAADGQILVHGPQVFTGYAGDPPGTANALRDGWLATGDLGRTDTEGRLTVLGRRSELLVTSAGQAVLPGPLEHRLAAHPLIEHAVVVGDGRPCLGALITLDPEFLEHWRLEYWRTELGRRADGPARPAREENALRAEIGEAVAGANRTVTPKAAIGVFRVLGERLTRAEGLLTPASRLVREAVLSRFELEIDAMYQPRRPSGSSGTSPSPAVPPVPAFQEDRHWDEDDGDDVFRRQAHG